MQFTIFRLLVIIFLAPLGLQTPTRAQSNASMACEQNKTSPVTQGYFARPFRQTLNKLANLARDNQTNTRSYANTTLQLANMYRDVGAFKIAEICYKQAATLFTEISGPDSKGSAKTQSALAELYRQLARYKQAEMLLRGALKIQDSPARHSNSSKTDLEQLAATLATWAKLNQDQFRPKQAIALIDRALALQRKAGPGPRQSLANTISDRGTLLLFQGRLAEAGRLLRQGLKQRRESLDPDHPDIGQSLNLLGLLAQKQGRTVEAQKLFNQALVLFSKSVLRNHPLIAATKANLARVAQAQRKFRIAHGLLTDAIKHLKLSLDRDHPWIASSYVFLATNYRLQNRFDQSAPLFERAISIFEKVYGKNHPQVGELLHNLAFLHSRQDRHADALGFYRRSLKVRRAATASPGLPVANTLNQIGLVLASMGQSIQAASAYKESLNIREKLLGPNHPLVASSLNNIATALKTLGKFTEAAPLFERSLQIMEAALGPKHGRVANILNNIADLKTTLAQYGEAERLLKRSIAIRIAIKGENHPDVAIAMNNLANVYQKQARFDDAKTYYKKTLKIRTKAYGRYDTRVATVLNNLGSLSHDRGQYNAAEHYYKNALEIRRKKLPGTHPDIALSLNNLAVLYHAMGRYDRAEKLFNQSRSIWEKTLGPNHPQIAVSLNNLAALYQDQGRYEDAEPVFKRSLAIRIKLYGITHPEAVIALNNLAVLYNAQGRAAEAEKYFLRVVNAQENAKGTNQLNVALALNNLAAFYEKYGRYNQAEKTLQRSLKIRQSLLPADHPDISVSLGNLAQIIQQQGKHAEAENLFKRSMDIAIKTKGPEHHSIAGIMNNLAILKEKTGQPDEALRLYKKSLAIKGRTFGTNHPSVVTSLSNIADYYLQRKQWQQAVSYYEKTTDVISRRSRTSALATGKPLTGKKRSEAAQSSLQFSLYVKAAFQHMLAANDDEKVLAAKMFRVAQRGATSQAAASLAQMAARQGAGNSPLATLVRKRQDLVLEWQKLDALHSANFALASVQRTTPSKPDINKRLQLIDQNVAAIDTQLAKQFPQFAVLANPAAVSIKELQRKLRPDEALLYYLDTSKQKPLPQATFIWAITREDFIWFRSPLGSEKLNTMVTKLRKTLDRSSQQAQRSVILSFDKPKPDAGYDFDVAHTLYKNLLKPAQRLLSGKKQLLFVPSGPLTSLPFQVLITAPYNDRSNERPAWLIRKFAITTLPTVSSLSVLRGYPRENQAPKSFIAFADPKFVADPKFQIANTITSHRKKAPSSARSSTSKSADPVLRSGLSAYFRGKTADPSALATLAQLPDTAEEVRSIASTFKTGTQIYLGRNANEETVKREKLNLYRVIHFATHGLVAGELKSLAQPALALSVPTHPDATNDGLLTSSEIATLKLNANWVILSACNTAAGDKPGAQALSGLANAFFYAGARSLLVSHWPVVSSAAVKLTTTTFRELQKKPAIGKAEALRRAMIALADSGEPRQRDPSYWAPFVIVGDNRN